MSTDSPLGPLPAPDSREDIDWSSLSPQASLLYAQVLQHQTLVDGTADATELGTLDEVAEQLGLDRQTCKELHDELADLGDTRASQAPVELARQLYDALDADQREPVFTALVHDLARLSLVTEETPTDEERNQVLAVATVAFPDSAKAVVRKARQHVEADRATVERDRDSLQAFVKQLDPKDIKNGNWFIALLNHAVRTYTEKVDWKYFQDKYPGMPAPMIVDQRIKMAVRYASIEGGLAAGAFAGACLAPLPPVVVAAASTTITTDVAYITRLQLCLAWDIAMLYRVPLDLDDPHDLWKLIRVAFTIQGAAVGKGVIGKGVPAIVKELIKKYFAKDVLKAAKALPVVGKYLLKRTVVKMAVPVVSVPLAIVLNAVTTQLAGDHARSVFRDEARLVELAEKLTNRTRHPHLLPWVAFLVITRDGKATDDEATLMHHLLRLLYKRYDVHDEALAKVIDLDPDDVWRRIDAETDDLSDLLEAARRIAKADGSATKREEAVIEQLAARCDTAS